jgi:hypothetical protein
VSADRPCAKSRTVVSLAGCLLLLVSGCGSGTTMSAAAGRQLRQDVLAVTEAAAAQDAAAAAAGLIRLHGRVLDFQRAGNLSAGKAAQIEAAAERVADDLALLAPASESGTPPPPRTSTPSSTSSTTPETTPHKKGKGKGRGRG